MISKCLILMDHVPVFEIKAEVFVMVGMTFPKLGTKTGSGFKSRNPHFFNNVLSNCGALHGRDKRPYTTREAKECGVKMGDIERELPRGEIHLPIGFYKALVQKFETFLSFEEGMC